MKQFIKEKDFDSQFDKYWENLNHEFFKCETLQYYNEEGEEEFLLAFKNGQINKLHKMLEEDVRGNESLWQDAQKRKIEFIRIHVFITPLTEYLKFELEAYKVQSNIGNEKIYLVSKEMLKNNNSKLKDFMLFDNKRAIIVKHNSKGKIIGATLTDEKEDIRKLLRFKNEMLKISIPLDKFLTTCNKQ